MDSGAHLADFLNWSSRTSTFVSVDVVGSTDLKTGHNEQDIIYTFLAYHKWVGDLAYTYHGEVISITGDGIMSRFQRAEDAIRLIQDLLNQWVVFNKKQNRLTQPLMLRIGAHTGQVLESDNMGSGQIISKTIDIAAKLQKMAEPNHARLSEAVLSPAGTNTSEFKRIGWDASLSTNVFDYSVGDVSSVSAARKLPIPIRMLIVEPELEQIAVIKKTLADRRYDCFAVFNRDQASLALKAWAPHFMLLSLDLPWQTGWELLSNLRADSALSGVPIVTMSRQATGDTIQKSFKIGANGFLGKPVDEQQILKRVETVLREFYQ
jgi:class 3 adenylate cyclase/CheY-like chemotaxis protein